MDGPLLSVEGLQTHFASELGTIKAVDGVSFEIPRGGILGMVGSPGRARA